MQPVPPSIEERVQERIRLSITLGTLSHLGTVCPLDSPYGLPDLSNVGDVHPEGRYK